MSISKQLLQGVGHLCYRLPKVGIHARRLFERFNGKASYQTQAYWDESLSGWASSYLGGTLTVNLGNVITVELARAHCPAAESVLDVGCAGSTLISCLGQNFKSYLGIDISAVAIAQSLANFEALKWKQSALARAQLCSVEEFNTSEKFDLIVFNEILYYLTMDQVSSTLRRFQDFLSPSGVIVISLKNHSLSQLISGIAHRELCYVGGVIYQRQPTIPSWRIKDSREMPAYLVQAFRSRKG